nr:tyrosine-type recombinase/integrase [Burkholderia alba]
MKRVSEAELLEWMRKTTDEGDCQTQLALPFMALMFVRTSELRFAEWTGIDEQKKAWRIPAEKMKMRSPHIVLLSKRALEVTAKFRALNGHSRYLFPSRSSPDKPISENTSLYALYPVCSTKV